MKKTALLVLPIIFASMFSSSAFASFSDVSNSNQYQQAINYVQANNIVSGYPDGTFKPDRQINRAEFTKILIAATTTEEQISNCTSINLFKDISEGAWYTKYICVAKNKGVISGYEDNSFRPDQNISFSEASKILVKSFGFPADSNTALWYKPYIDVLTTKKAIPTSIAGPSALITRGEMAEIISRLKQNITSKDSAGFDQTGSWTTNSSPIVTYNQCVPAGGLVNSTVSPQNQTQCCSGLVPYLPAYDKGQLRLGGSAVCLEPQTGLADAIKLINAPNSCTLNSELGQTYQELPMKNPKVNGFSFPMTSYKPLCAARCDVNLDTKQVNIGWMCTGSI